MCSLSQWKSGGGSPQIESVSSILTCTDLEVNGTGKSVVQVDEVTHTPHSESCTYICLLLCFRVRIRQCFKFQFPSPKMRKSLRNRAAG